jgi:PleD family two-component response regulator
MMEKKIRLPVVFLTVNKDFDVVIKVMKLGVADYLVKEEISSPVLPKTILSVIEKHRLRDRLMQIEVSQQRLNVIRETVSTVLEDLQRPLFEMKDLSTGLRSKIRDAGRLNYLRIVDENLLRIIEKLDKLKELKEDKTIQYIKDIKMLDLS